MVSGSVMAAPVLLESGLGTAHMAGPLSGPSLFSYLELFQGIPWMREAIWVLGSKSELSERTSAFNGSAISPAPIIQTMMSLEVLGIWRQWSLVSMWRDLAKSNLEDFSSDHA